MVKGSKESAMAKLQPHQEGSGHGESKQHKGHVGPYAAALGLKSVGVPLIAAMITVLVYVVPMRDPYRWVNDCAVPIGIVGGAVLWLLAAVPAQRSACARYANMASYDSIHARLRQLEARLGTFDAQPHAKPGTLTEQVAACTNAYEEARSCSEAIKEALHKDRALAWAQGTGYLNVWNLIYLAEEALIEIEPLSMVLAGALHDESRIEGSTIDNREALLDKVRAAVAVLAPQAVPYLDKLPPTPRQACGAAVGTASLQTGAVLTVKGQVGRAKSEFRRIRTWSTSRWPHVMAHPYRVHSPDQQGAYARAVLREVRYTIDKFRGLRWAGLVRARKARLATALVTGLTAYVLLAVAVTRHAPTTAIVAAVVFFLIGAIIGLFNRMYGEYGDDTGVDDYGLSTARLILIPLISGLAAVGGVLVTTVFSNIGTPPHLKLDAIFDLNSGPYGLLIAAAFGLAPGLLLSGLHQQADKYKADLKSSQASDGAHL
jgi:hypothetical protein